jgi:hypothetical protein
LWEIDEREIGLIPILVKQLNNLNSPFVNKLNRSLIFAILSICTNTAMSQVSLKSLTTAYVQNFNTLKSSGLSSTVPLGWVLLETGANANITYEANTGSLTTGNTYSYGIGTNADRAFGVLGSGSLSSTLGASFKNLSGKILRAVTITYTGEMWRKGEVNRDDMLDFQFSTNATSLATGTWTDNSSLDFISPNSSVVGAKDGNLAVNRKLITSTIAGLSIPANAIFWIRWKDFDATGSEDGLGIDDFKISISATDVTPPTIMSFSPLSNSTDNPINGVLKINFSEPIAKGTGSIHLKRFSDGAVIQSILSSDPSVSISGQAVSIPYAGTTYNTPYYVEISNGCFKDLTNNSFAGISGSSTWNFSTQSGDKLKIVNWNIEWFGHSSLGPTDDALQEQNVKTIFQNINADLYMLGEIVNVGRLNNIVSQMPGYEYIVSDFCSASTNTTGCTSDQKLAFVFRSSVVKKIRSYGVLRSPNSSASADYNWSSGRFPFLMEADVFSNGFQKKIQFIAVHAKANTPDFIESYNKRKNGAIELRDSLLVQYPTSNWMVLGDYNDDLDKTITTQMAPITESSFASFTNEPSFRSVTLPLSLAGQPSTVSYPDFIDHVTVSNEMHQYYVPNSARTLKTEVEAWVTNFGNTTSDHYPIYTEFIFTTSASQLAMNRSVIDAESPTKDFLIKSFLSNSMLHSMITSSYEGPATLQIIDMNGRVLSTIQSRITKGMQQFKWNTSNWPAGIYFIRIQTQKEHRVQKVYVPRN